MLAAGELDHVVPVTARRRALLGRHVASREADPDEVRESIREQRLLQRLRDAMLPLELPPLRHVLHGADHAEDRPVLPPHDAGLPDQHPRLPVRADDAVLDVRDLAAVGREGAGDVRLDPSAILRERELDRSFERDALLGRDPVHPVHLARPMDLAGADVPVPGAEARELLRLRQAVVCHRELPRSLPDPLLERSGRLLEGVTGACAFADDGGEEERRERDGGVERLQREHPTGQGQAVEETAPFHRGPCREEGHEQRRRRGARLLEAPGGPPQDREQQEDDGQVRGDDERGDADQRGDERGRLDQLPPSGHRVLADRRDGE